LILRQKIRWGRLDTLLLLSLAGGFAWLGYQVDAGLEYRWNWQTIPQYLLRYDPGEARWVPNLLLEGLLTTIRLSCWSLVLAMPLGLAIGLLRTSLHLFNKLLGGSYVALLRNLPPLVLVLIFYFFISDQLLPLLHIADLLSGMPPAMREAVALAVAPPDQLEAFIAAVLTLALFESAYIAEIVRAGINSIESGQWQVARALGMRRWQLMRHVILPQALQRMIPPLTGQAISTIKDSAIVSVISIQELTFQGMELMAATYLTFEVWLTVTLLYFILTYSCSCLAGQLEKRLRRAY
jgi:polar amino acid transport system permease protein